MSCSNCQCPDEHLKLTDDWLPACPCECHQECQCDKCVDAKQNIRWAEGYLSDDDDWEATI